MDKNIKKELIVKSNDLVEASYRLTTSELKIMSMIISQVDRHDIDFKDYTITIKDFINRLELKGQSMYSEIKKIIRLLRSRTFTIKHDSGELITGWISNADYRQNEGLIVFNLDPKLKPYIIGLKSGFTPYKLKNVLRLNSFYAGRIYELLKQYQNIGERTFTIDELKDILCINKDEYKLYGHFKTRVILPTQDELKNKTDIYFDFKEITEGRKVVKIKFSIHSKIIEVEAEPKKSNYSYKNTKPSNIGNFEQRKYDDKFYDNLYDNNKWTTLFHSRTTLIFV